MTEPSRKPRHYASSISRASFASMCTVVLSIRPSHILIGANRDERLDRPWDSPAAWWPQHPEVIGGRDRSAGGTWLGMNRAGVVATVLNRPGTLGPAQGKRSRGELPLLALGHESAATAAEAIQRLNADAWRPFNMVIADREGAFFIRGSGEGLPETIRLPTGVSMITSHDPNDLEHPRTSRHLPRFIAREPADALDWQAWRTILADRSGPPQAQINVAPRSGYGTASSSLITFAANGAASWLFAAGPPDMTPYVPVAGPWNTGLLP